MSFSALSDEEILSLQVLSLLRFDRIKFKCYSCEDDNKQVMNCNMEREGESVFYSPEFQIEFETCPINYIVPCHYDFIDKYNFLQEFPHTMTSYEETLPNFWAAYQLFKGYCNKFELEDMDKKQEQNKKPQTKAPNTGALLKRFGNKE